MPTPLPVSFLAELDSRNEFLGPPTAATMLIPWAASMLLIGAIAHFGPDASALNSIELLAIF